MNELFLAQAQIYKHIFSYMDSMSLKCAVQLGIPDIIHKHHQPITLPELVSALQIPPTKTSYVHQLMRLLVHSGFFATQKIGENQEQEGYVLTPSSRYLLKDNTTSLSPFVLALLDPALVTPWQFMADWFQGSQRTAFETAHGMTIWDYAGCNPEIQKSLDEALASDSRIVSSVIHDYKEIFEGLASLVDVGGGTGTVAKTISEAFPHLKCMVLELPRVIADLPNTKNLEYIGGDMFESIPSADAVLMKCVLHDWADEDCIKILKRCKEAISSSNGGGKVIIIEMVVNDKNDAHDLKKAKLFLDMLMMGFHGAKERNEKEWEKLFMDVGFSHYKITPTSGLYSLIEVFP